MSDVSILSQEYETASQLSQKINRVAIYLKKHRLGLTSTSQEASVAQADASHLVGILNALCQHLSAEGSRTEDSSALNIPVSLVERLQNQHRGDMPYYIEDVQHIAERLNTASLDLDDEELGLLNQLASTADAETSSVFRRLMRK